jgi:hypothetical protein
MSGPTENDYVSVSFRDLRFYLAINNELLRDESPGFDRIQKIRTERGANA